MCSESAEKDIRRLHRLFNEQIITEEESITGNALGRCSQQSSEAVKRKLLDITKEESGTDSEDCPNLQSDSEDSASEENEEEDEDWEEAEEAEEAEEEEAEESCAESKPQDKFATVLREFSAKQGCKDYVQSHEFKWVFARTVNAYTNSGQTGGVYHCGSHVECRACLRYRDPRKGEEK
ncbi:hypothetical protein CYMTET_4167 [Cymbomonas tetramitiformis]|uniref:Uncharacterized protein n=1 Tax=Cymbomonas tetramitiformis TaxID=36881 RepID=A0AAE0H1Z3_9CHLO|nr:hypothetical protein CYMTET_4167 [Cymbomonas tetramitiformis]